MFEDFMNNGTRERRARCLLALVLAMFGVLGVRLYSLQIGDWERYRIQSEKNTMQPVPLEASRGLIRDRNGIILVDNRPSYTISVIPPRFLQGLESAEVFGDAFDLDDRTDSALWHVSSPAAKRRCFGCNRNGASQMIMPLHDMQRVQCVAIQWVAGNDKN